MARGQQVMIPTPDPSPVLMGWGRGFTSASPTPSVHLGGTLLTRRKGATQGYTTLLRPRRPPSLLSLLRPPP